MNASIMPAAMAVSCISMPAPANAAMAAMVKEKTDTCLGKVLYEASMAMKNGFSRSDA